MVSNGIWWKYHGDYSKIYIYMIIYMCIYIYKWWNIDGYTIRCNQMWQWKIPCKRSHDWLLDENEGSQAGLIGIVPHCRVIFFEELYVENVMELQGNTFSSSIFPYVYIYIYTYVHFADINSYTYLVSFMFKSSSLTCKITQMEKS